MKRIDVLNAAEKCVNGERDAAYGSPEDNFLCIAQMWNAYRARMQKDYFRPRDVAAMLALLKVARIANGNATEDSWVDLAGYAACGGELDTDEQQREG